MLTSLEYPFDYKTIQRKKRSLKKDLENSSQNFLVKRIAILGGSTTLEVQNMLELFLLKNGIKPIFYQSEYNRYFEDIVLSGSSLEVFQPEVIYIHTTSVNITNWPEMSDTVEKVEEKIVQEASKFENLWKLAAKKYNCIIVQNNFEYLNLRELGNADTTNFLGKNNFILKMNNVLVEKSSKFDTVFLNDINYLSSLIGLNNWHSAEDYFNYKYAMSHQGIIHLAHNLSSIITTQLGKAKKCIVLDLDNTLWGGVIGDDGVGGIALGNETALGEAFLYFQKYVKRLKERGIILAVCSKNDLANAKKGFDHPDSVLKVNDFSEFVANWENKHFNLVNISKNLNIGIDSIVFVDDNPAERELVINQLPDIKVINFGESIINLMNVLDHSLAFDAVVISKDDFLRGVYYQENKFRENQVEKFETYEEYLTSLKMEADILGFTDLYVDRITQLTNKTNQFNLTTKRCTLTEIKQRADQTRYISFCMRLRDKFGDNGIVTVLSGQICDQELRVDLWLMSCRVFKRTLENTAFDILVQKCKEKNIKRIVGDFIPSSKNNIVAALYPSLGFEKISESADGSVSWGFEVGTSSEFSHLFIKTREEG